MLGELRALIEWSGYSLVAFHRAFCDNGLGKKIGAEPKTAPRPAPATATAESSRRESARCRSLAGSVVCSAAIRFCPLCEESISTAVKSVSSNRPGSKLWDRIVAVRQRGLEPGEVASVVGPAE